MKFNLKKKFYLWIMSIFFMSVAVKHPVRGETEKRRADNIKEATGMRSDWGIQNPSGGLQGGPGCLVPQGRTPDNERDEVECDHRRSDDKEYRNSL